MDKILHIIKKFIPQKLFKAMRPAYHFLLSWTAAVLYCRPSEKLVVIGVTGTIGKTTCVYMIAKMLASAGYKTGFTSTAMFSDGRKEWLNNKKMTMAGRSFTQKMLRRMIKNGCQYAIVETTSEGIVQFRHKFINYDILIFTGLYPEHIESHGSFANYRKAKGKLFTHLKRCRTKYADDEARVQKVKTGMEKINLNRIKKVIIANGDDEHADYFLGFQSELKFAYMKESELQDLGTPAYDEALAGGKEMNGIEAAKYGDVEASGRGIIFSTGGTRINLQLLGAFNAANAMTAICVGLARDIPMARIKKGMEAIKGVPGRLEKIDEGQDFTVIVDYAYEPGAVAKLYEAIKLIPHEKVIHVLGSAGGGRDIARRPKLGELAGKNADYVIVTNEDPYDDDPEIIISQVALGAEKAGEKINKNLFKILDRRAAIKKALALADKDDIVLITGKGSEQAICAADGRKIPWDDRKVVRELLSKK